MKPDEQSEKGYSYVIEDEKIKEYMKLTTEEKLEWLESINYFNSLLLTAEQKEIREKLRSAEF